VSLLDRLFRRGERTAAKQEDDAHALDREGDPRGGAKSREYTTADPREVLEEDGTVFGAPGGSPQDGPSVEERRRAELADD
jgi:hypothetical protein